MGRPNRMSSGGGDQEHSCCGCRKGCSSFLLYLLVIISLCLSILIFWMTLYRHQELRLHIDQMEREYNATLVRLVDSHVSQLKLVAMKNERVGENHTKELKELRQKFTEVKTGETDDEAIRIVKEMRTAYGELINSLTRKVSGLDKNTEATRAALKRLETDKQSPGDDSLRTINETVLFLDVQLGNLKTIVEQNRLETESHTSDLDSIRESIVDLESSRSKLLDQLISGDRDVNAKLLDAEKNIIENGGRIEDLEVEKERMLETIDNVTEMIKEMVHDGMTEQFAEVHTSLEEINETLSGKLEELTERVGRTPTIDSVNQLARLSDSTASQLADLRLNIQRLDSQGEHLKEADEQVNQRLETLSAEAHDSDTEISMMKEKLNHFVRSLLKVKALPAEMNELIRKVQSLEGNLQGTVDVVQELRDKVTSP